MNTKREELDKEKNNSEKMAKEKKYIEKMGN